MDEKNPQVVYLPLEQPERAAQIKPEELLPQQVYEHLIRAIDSALRKNPAEDPHDFDEQRVHNAILLDGDRGMGKTTVLVNLPQVLKRRRGEEFMRQVHVLKPVDPTLLEDGDNLFLNVVVAAVLSDRRIDEARRRGDPAAQMLNRRVQRLGEALEGRQTQEREIGLDRLRAFVGSHELARRVHEFFEAALNLLNAQLLVLPIDDVDTSLGRAFENLEVVRRYLATPLVLPVVCGDLNLYSSLLWRESFRRLHPGLQASETAQGLQLHELAEAKDQARNLAQEYLRKVLPVSLRCQMPALELYLANPRVVLRTSQSPARPLMNLPLFHAWLRALLLGPVNLSENSADVPLPLSSVRALVQTVGASKELLPPLFDTLSQMTPQRVLETSDVQLQTLRLQRAMQMPGITADQMERFAEQAAQKVKLESAYVSLGPQAPSTGASAADPLMAHVPAWLEVLGQQWRHERKAGRAMLVIKAWKHWNAVLNQPRGLLRVLETPLFRPSLQQHAEFRHYEGHVDLNWRERLRNYYPESALRKLPALALAPMAVPELGRPLAKKYSYRAELGDIAGRDAIVAEDANLVTRLLIDDDFYSTSQRSKLLQVGRLLELLVMSLVADVTESDVHALLTRAPYNSVTDVAPTKTLDDGDDEPAEPDEAEEVGDDGSESEAVSRLVTALKQWRHDWRSTLEVTLPSNGGAEGASRMCRVSPWLLYCVLNKVLNQAEYFNPGVERVKNSRDVRRVAPTRLSLDKAWAVARTAFNAFWSALGSFEKGPVFGLPSVVATVNPQVAKGQFESLPLYKQNVAPFASKQAAWFGRATGSLTAALQDHPLRLMLARVQEAWVHAEDEPEQPRPTPSKWLLAQLGVRDANDANKAATRRAIERQLRRGDWTYDRARHLLQNLVSSYPRAKDLELRLIEAIHAVFPDQV